MIEIENETDLFVDELQLKKIASSLTKRDIELIITTNSEIQEINKAHRGIDKSTDVLSFPYEETYMSPLGSIVISCDYVREKALELGHTNEDETALLFIHGLLHLLGYDHEVDNGQMRDEEVRLITKFNLPKSLIVRTNEIKE